MAEAESERSRAGEAMAPATSALLNSSWSHLSGTVSRSTKGLTQRPLSVVVTHRCMGGAKARLIIRSSTIKNRRVLDILVAKIGFMVLSANERAAKHKTTVMFGKH